MNSKLLGYAPHHRIRALNVERTTPRLVPRQSDVWSFIGWMAAALIGSIMLSIWFGP